MTSPLDNERERTPPQTERTRERGFEFDLDEDELDESRPGKTMTPAISPTRGEAIADEAVVNGLDSRTA